MSRTPADMTDTIFRIPIFKDWVVLPAFGGFKGDSRYEVLAKIPGVFAGETSNFRIRVTKNHCISRTLSNSQSSATPADAANTSGERIRRAERMEDQYSMTSSKFHA